MGTVRGMCGRYVSVSSPTILAERFKVETVRIDKLEPRYNVTPAPRSQSSPKARASECSTSCAGG